MHADTTHIIIQEHYNEESRFALAMLCRVLYPYMLMELSTLQLCAVLVPVFSLPSNPFHTTHSAHM